MAHEHTKLMPVTPKGGTGAMDTTKYAVHETVSGPTMVKNPTLAELKGTLSSVGLVPSLSQKVFSSLKSLGNVVSMPKVDIGKKNIGKKGSVKEIVIPDQEKLGTTVGLKKKETYFSEGRKEKF